MQLTREQTVAVEEFARETESRSLVTVEKLEVGEAHSGYDVGAPLVVVTQWRREGSDDVEGGRVTVLLDRYGRRLRPLEARTDHLPGEHVQAIVDHIAHLDDDQVANIRETLNRWALEPTGGGG